MLLRLAEARRRKGGREEFKATHDRMGMIVGNEGGREGGREGSEGKCIMNERELRREERGYG